MISRFCLRALPSTRRAYMYVCNIHTCMCVCVCMYVYISIYIYTHIHTYMHICACARTHTHTRNMYMYSRACCATSCAACDNSFQILSRILRSLSRRDALPRWAANHHHNSTTTLAPTSLQLRQYLPQKQRQVPRKQQSRDPGHPAGAWREGERVLY